MNTRLNALCLGGILALVPFLAQPVRADEWNKKTEFEFSGPVQIPGKVLAAGKYVFQLEDSESDRYIVQVFSEDSNGKESLVATLIAVPEYREETPDKPMVRFDERPAGTPEAIHSWFYPGDNTGWQFVYPKGETLGTAANMTPAPAPVTAAAAPSMPDPPQVQDAEPTDKEVAEVEEEVTAAEPAAPAAPAAEVALVPTPEADSQAGADRMLPETGGLSVLELAIGLSMVVGGIAVVSASRRTSAVLSEAPGAKE
ncbi:MAG: hypothetical protein JWP63_3098 [Candidatus Solibacter sp.]|nr:hypothetical protein [Candidatus Solibacter sp.]